MRFALRILTVVAALLVAWLLLAPVPIDPRPWSGAPNDGFTGPYRPNRLLTSAEPIEMPSAGPEDVTRGPDGALYTGLADGRIVRVDPGSGAVTTYANTGGRPLGLRFDHTGTLLVADAVRGLIAVTPDGGVRVLVDSAGSRRLTFPDAVDVAPDGTVWLTDASARWDYQTAGVLDFWESRPSGRLIRYDPGSGAATVVLDSLDFGNGVAVGPGGAWLLVNETMPGRIRRLWLAGPKAGRSEIFVEGLPGMPDNLGYDGEGTFWVGLFGPRTKETMTIRRLPPFVRKMIYRIPERLRVSEADRYGMVIGLDTLGRVRYNLQDPTGRYYTTTGAVAANGILFVSTLTGAALARVALPPVASP